MDPRTWFTSLIARLEDLMHRMARPAPYLAVALVVAACASGSTSSPAAVASPEATASQVASAAAPTTSASPSAADPTPSASSSAFISNTYGYSLTVPAGWTTVQAMLAWDGKGMPGHDVAEADQFISQGTASSWFYGAPTTKDLAGQVKQAIAGIAIDHGDTCPPLPASQDPIKIGGEPGILLSYDCGILINNAVAVLGGKSYLFGFRDPAIHAATDPADREIFVDLLVSVKFPE